MTNIPQIDSNFKVLEYDIAVKDELLAEALQELHDRKRDIILLSYFLGYNDVEIAERLNPVRRTVNDHRNKVLKDLKNRMEGKSMKKNKAVHRGNGEGTDFFLTLLLFQLHRATLWQRVLC